MLKNILPWDLPRKKEPIESNPVIGNCPKCGLEIRIAMWYCCLQSNCPSGLGSRGTL